MLELFDTTNITKFPKEIPNIGRDSLPTLFKECGFVKGAEIGVEQGIFSQKLCAGIPNLHLYCIDPWLAYEGYRKHITQQIQDSYYQDTKNRLSDYKCTFIREFSTTALSHFEDESLDFVYIDGNHEFKYAYEDIKNWTSKVRKGGIISGHDYIMIDRASDPIQVKKAVDAIVKDCNVQEWFVLGRKEKIQGEVRDMSRSWLWFKK